MRKTPVAGVGQGLLQGMEKMEGHHVHLRVPSAHMSGSVCERKVGRT